MTTVDEKIVNSKLGVDSNKLSEGDEAVLETGHEKTEEGDSSESPTPDDKDKKLAIPAVLPQFQYSKEQLMAIKDLPLSKKRPDCLLASFNNSRGVWDPERWHLNQKRSETPPDDTGKSDVSDGHKRRSGDPRERLRKEQDGIVLSPQRRSFNTGCSMSQPSLSRRPDSPLGKSDRERDIIHREIPTRRIGSGRISARERDPWDFRLDRDKDTDSTGDFNSFQRATNSRDRDDRFERRSYGRDFGDRIDRDKDRHRNSRGYDRNDRMDCRMDRMDRNDRRRGYSESREEEPEWFSAGPTSQHDTIELRGFEDIPEDQPAKLNSRKQPLSNKASTKLNPRTSASIKPSSSATTNSSETKPSSPPSTVQNINEKPPSAPSPVDCLDSEQPKNQNEKRSSTPKRASPKPEVRKANKPDDSELNFLDAFLKSDTIPVLLANGVEGGGPANSRFSQYFVVNSSEQKQQQQQADSRRNSLQDEIVNNIMQQVGEHPIGSLHIPSIGDSEAYFAPISPAASTAVIGSSALAPPQPEKKPNTLLEMLQRSQGERTKAPSIQDLAAKGKIQSVEELEAKMMMQNKNNSVNSVGPKNTSSEEDMLAFRKLLAQVIDSKEVPPTSANGQRPTIQSQNDSINFFRILSNKGGGDGALHPHPVSQLGGGNMTRGLQQQQPQHHQTHTNPQSMHVPPDLVLKLLEVQRAGEMHVQRAGEMHMHRAREVKRQHQQQCQKELFDKLVAAQAQPQIPPSSARPMPGFGHSLSPLPPDIQQLVNSGPPSQELLQRPEAQCIIQGLNRGELTSQHVISQLQNPATQPRQREILANILKAQAQSGISPRANSPHMPMGSQPTDMLQHMIQQQQSQQQLRIPSPHNNAFCAPPPVISPNMTGNPNTLSVQHPGLPRIPSPHELVVHTQNILQSALIKKKLEEQRENYRKRQELQQSVSPNNLAMASNTGSPRVSEAQQQKVSSPSPLSFTPTSVLRKMTADKEPEPVGVPMRSDVKQPLYSQSHNRNQGVNMQQQQQQQQHQVQQQQRPQPQPSSTWNVPPAKQPAGRPIVKGSANFQTYTSTDYQPSQNPMQPPLYSQVAPGGSGGYSNTASRSKMPMTNPPPNSFPPGTRPVMNLMMYARPPMNQMNYARVDQKKAAAHVLTQLQQNQPQLQHLPPHQQQSIRNLAQNPAFQNLTRQSFQQLLHGQNFGNTNRSSSGDGAMRQQSQPMPVRQSQSMNMHSGNELSVSPTSNQLAQWFSPELLAQAKAGRLAGMPPISAMQNILSLEELERLQQSSAAVHN